MSSLNFRYQVSKSSNDTPRIFTSKSKGAPDRKFGKTPSPMDDLEIEHGPLSSLSTKPARWFHHILNYKRLTLSVTTLKSVPSITSEKVNEVGNAK